MWTVSFLIIPFHMPKILSFAASWFSMSSGWECWEVKFCSWSKVLKDFQLLLLNLLCTSPKNFQLILCIHQRAHCNSVFSDEQLIVMLQPPFNLETNDHSQGFDSGLWPEIKDDKDSNNPAVIASNILNLLTMAIISWSLLTVKSCIYFLNMLQISPKPCERYFSYALFCLQGSPCLCHRHPRIPKAIHPIARQSTHSGP